MNQEEVSHAEEISGGVLMVGPEEDFCKRVFDLLADTGYPVQATDSAKLIEEIQQHSYNLVLLDFSSVQSAKGAILDQILKTQPWLSVVIMAKAGGVEPHLEAIRKGVYSYLTHPVPTETLDLVLRNGVERSLLLAENAALKDKVLTDDLTQAYNRRYLEMYLDEELERSRRYDHPFSILFIDLNHLKKINDQHGHIAGSQVLQEVASLLKEKLRKSDKIFRFGGDEFVVGLPETDSEQALVVERRLNEALRRHRILLRPGVETRITGSLGVATYPLDGATKEQLIRHADEAMYRSKAAMQDRTH